MDFCLTTEQTDIKQAAIDFAKGEFDPDAALEYDKEQKFPLSIWKKASKLGFIGVNFSEQYGGQDCGLLEYVLIAESFCQQDSGIGMALALSDFGSGMILRYGNESQKRIILPIVAQGKGIATLAFLEEGSTLSPFKTYAKINKNRYTINGEKSFVALGDLATYIIIVCQTGRDNPRAQSVILIEGKMNGITVASMGEKLGMRMIPVYHVSFNDVKVEEKNIIGKKGDGYSQLQHLLMEMRIKAGAVAIGIAQGGLERALEYSKKRQQFGKPIIRFDVIRNKCADMYIDTEMARLITYKAAWSFDSGKPDKRAIFMAKMVATRAACRNTYEAVQIHGGYGYMTEGHIEHFYRDAKALDLFLETGQMQKIMLADQITGQAS